MGKYQNLLGTTEADFKVGGSSAGKSVLTTDSNFSIIQGLEASVNAGNTQYLDTAIGKATIDSNGIPYVVTSAAFTKRLNAAWAIGTNAGGLLTGSSFPASTTLHSYVMRRRSDGTVDHGYHTSAAQTTFVDGSSNTWDLKWHWSFTTGASSINAFKQIGDECLLDVAVGDVTANIPTTGTLYTMTGVPNGVTGLKVKGYAQWGVLTSPITTIYFILSSPHVADVAPSVAAQTGISNIYGTTPASGFTSTVPFEIVANSSRQIRARASAVSNFNTYLFTTGYIHPRGGNPTATQAIVLSGAILQVSSTTSIGQLSTSSTTYVDSGLSLTFGTGLKQTSSKVRVRLVVYTGHGSAGGFTTLTIYRNGTTDLAPNVADGMGVSTMPGSNNTVFLQVVVDFVDNTPGTNPIYNIYWRAGAGTSYINRRGSSASPILTSYFTLEEIAA